MCPHRALPPSEMQLGGHGRLRGDRKLTRCPSPEVGPLWPFSNIDMVDTDHRMLACGDVYNNDCSGLFHSLRKLELIAAGNPTRDCPQRNAGKIRL